MGYTKNLGQQEALREIQAVVKEINTCMFCTYRAGRLKSRPMWVQRVDEEGNIWFLSDRNSDKNQELKADSSVELLFAGSHERYMALHGTAEIIFDKTKIYELWQPVARVWFTGGADDPAISIIRVKYDDGYYWDTRHGYMMSLVNRVKSLVTGVPGNDGVEGALRQ